jgi:hypothetical protein
VRALNDRRIIVLLSCVLFASCEQRSDDLSAKQIAARMSAAYISARSYRDHGVAFVDEPLGWTIFEAIFRLHSLDHFSTELDRSLGSMTFVFDSVRVTGTPSEVPQRLIDVRPISKGSSTIVPMLLLGVAPDFVNPVRQHDDSVHGAECYVIRATNSHVLDREATPRDPACPAEDPFPIGVVHTDARLPERRHAIAAVTPSGSAAPPGRLFSFGRLRRHER